MSLVNVRQVHSLTFHVLVNSVLSELFYCVFYRMDFATDQYEGELYVIINISINIKRLSHVGVCESRVSVLRFVPSEAHRWCGYSVFLG